MAELVTECKCVPAMLANGVAEATCPVHGVAAFLRGLPVEPEDDQGFEVDDGSEI